jgi:DNA-binding beta-propeller fold protein YncE
LDSGKAAELLHFNVYGKLLQRFSESTSGPHLFNDLVLRNSSEVYLTDSLANKVLRFARTTHTFTALPLPRPLYYPNGIAISADGNLLYIADAFGVLQFDLRSQKGHEVQPGASNTVSGIDGLYWYRGRLIGIQNSLGLPRIAQFQLSPDGSRVTATKVLEYRSDSVELPTTGAIDGSNFYFMANTQGDNWKDEKIVDPKKLAPIRIAVIHLD